MSPSSFDLSSAANWRFLPGKGWNPTRLFYRNSKQVPASSNGQQESWKIGSEDEGNPAYTLEPWLHWNHRHRQGNWFSIYGEATPDMLMVGAIRPASWLDPKRIENGQPQAPAIVSFTLADGGLGGEFPLTWGRRQWMLAVTERDPSLANLSKPSGSVERNTSPPPQLLLIKHGDFPLNLVKDYQLEWPDNQGKHPRLILRPADVEDRRKTADVAAIRKRMEQLQLATATVHPGILEAALEAYLITGDETLGKHLSETAAQYVQEAVDGFLKQTYLLTIGFAPHHRQQLATSLLFADAVMDGGHMAPKVRRRIEAQAAFLAYTLDREDFCSPVRGYAGLPNMTSSAYAYKATAACFIPTHPQAKAWIADALREMHRQIEEWSDDNGGWLEAPHYAMVAYDAILGVFVMAHNASLSEDLFHPKIKKVIEWFAKISTPPDSRLDGFRHLPPIGNTWMIEPSGEFGLIASLWREKDPAFARQMQWIFRQHRSWPLPGIGGGYPAFAGYRSLLLNPSIPEEAPSYGSELFPKTGVILRTGFPGPRETSLHMIAGEHRSHYDADSGSIVFWGKGRILCEDFGYIGRMPSEDHSMVTAMGLESKVMNIETFVPDPAADYVRGHADSWTRQILFVKSPDPSGPNYAVLGDNLLAGDPTATWRLWTFSDKLALQPRLARVEGREDVDMDVFLASAKDPAMRQETIQRTCPAGLLPDGQQTNAYKTTQTGLIVSMAGAPHLNAVLWPRMKAEKPPEFTSLAEGRVIRIRWGGDEDWVFLSRDPFTFKQDDIEFEGTAGLVQVRGGKAKLVLPCPGRLAARGQVLDKGKPAAAAASSNLLFVGGDFESGTNDLFPAESGAVRAKIHKGNPAMGTSHAGKYCLALTVEGETMPKYGNISLKAQLPGIDPGRTYRLGASVYTDQRIGLTCGGYASDGVNSKWIEQPPGKVWQYGVSMQGPSSEWQRLETTLGPPGSGADLEWPPNVAGVNLTLWIGGDDGPVYLDDLVLELLPPAQPPKPTKR